MKTLPMSIVAIFTITLISIPAWSQGREARGGGGGGGGRVGGGFIPQRGPSPAPARAPAAPRAPEPARAAQSNERAPRPPADIKGHPEAPHVHPNSQWVGHDSGPNDPIIALINPLNMVASRAASVPVMYGVLKVEVRAGSGSITSIGASLPTIWTCAATGCGITTIS